MERKILLMEEAVIRLLIRGVIAPRYQLVLDTTGISDRLLSLEQKQNEEQEYATKKDGEAEVQ